jgi:hypothetical protein
MKIFVLLIFASTFFLSCGAIAKQGDLYIYPANQQSADQLERDRFECYVWGSGEAGFDPSADDSNPSARVVRVAVDKNPNQNAAIVGTIVGSIAGAAIDDRHGAGIAIGASVGTLIGAGIEQQGQRKVEAQAQQTANEVAEARVDSDQRMANYRRAFSACLEGRGYVVR